MENEQMNLEEIGELMCERSSEKEYFFDTKTGKAHAISLHVLDAISGRAPVSAVSSSQEEFALAHELLNDTTDRFYPLDEIPQLLEFQWMAYFSLMVGAPAYEELTTLFDVSEKIRAFEATLARYPDEAQLWFYFRKGKLIEVAADWKEERGLNALSPQELEEIGKRFEVLRAWRNELARSEGVRPFRILSNRTLREVAARCPKDEGDLIQVSGMGPVKMSRYAQAILAQVKAFDAYKEKG